MIYLLSERTIKALVSKMTQDEYYRFAMWIIRSQDKNQNLPKVYIDEVDLAANGRIK